MMKRDTYLDLEQKHAESKIEFDSILFQIEEMETKISQMQLSVVKLKEYLKGCVFFPADSL